jgi:hypothetical protein
VIVIVAAEECVNMIALELNSTPVVKAPVIV